MEIESSANELKFCQQEVEFINKNFEAFDGGRVQRAVIYAHYVNFCKSIDIEPMSIMFLGKFIKILYPNLRIRRLGARGFSKYHYFGLRIKETSHLIDVQVPIFPSENDEEIVLMNEPKCDEMLAQEQEEFVNYIGDVSQENLSQLPSIFLEDNELLPEGINIEDLPKFEDFYKSHCNDILSIVAIMDLTFLPYLWNIFWNKGELYQNVFSMANIRLFSHCECIHKFVFSADCTFYSILINILIPDILKPIPESYVLVLRNLSKNMEPWLMKSLIGIPEGIFKAKLNAAKAFGQILRQYTALKHSLQACKTLFFEVPTLSQMLSDYEKIDFDFIMNQVDMMCKCDMVFIHTLEDSFKSILSSKMSIEKLMDLLDDIVSMCVLPSPTSTTSDLSAFMLSWSFAGNLVMRDLSLRCVPSLGAFNLLKLFSDDYMLYTVQRRMADNLETSICFLLAPKH